MHENSTGNGVDIQFDAAEQARQKSHDEIRNRFTYHPPKDGQLQRYETLRGEALQLALLIVNLTPPSREQSLALTKLEEAIMHANSAIARHE